MLQYIQIYCLPTTQIDRQVWFFGSIYVCRPSVSQPRFLASGVRGPKGLWSHPIVPPSRGDPNETTALPCLPVGRRESHQSPRPRSVTNGPIIHCYPLRRSHNDDTVAIRRVSSTTSLPAQANVQHQQPLHLLSAIIPYLPLPHLPLTDPSTLLLSASLLNRLTKLSLGFLGIGGRLACDFQFSAL